MAQVGLDSQYGYAEEATSGTFEAPDHFLPHTTAEANLNQVRYDSKGLQPGQYAQQAALSILTTRDGTFSVTREVLSKGEGGILNQLHGATVTPTTTTGSAKLQAHPLGLTLPNGRTSTHQFLAPGTDETDNVMSAIGCSVTSYKVMIERGGVLMTEQEYHATDVVTTEALATASYASSPELFSFDNATLLVGGSAPSEVVTACEFTFSIPRDTGRYTLAGDATPLPALVNDYVELTGSYTMELQDGSNFAAITSSSTTTLKLTCLGESNIATGRKAKFEVDCAAVQTQPHSISVPGPGVMTVTVPFKAVISSTNPVATINYESLDASL